MNNYKLVHVPGDGTCYFHSVAGYLELDKNIKKMKGDKKYTYFKKGNASQLRKQVVSWLRKNLDYKMTYGLTIRNEIEDAITQNPKLHSINDYLQDMSKDTAYAGQIEITATANLLRRNIRTFIKKGTKLSNVGLGYEIKQSKDDDIHLFHNLGSTKAVGLHHFEILYPKSKATIVAKSKYDTFKSKKTKPKKTVRRKITKTKKDPKRKLTKRRGRRP